MKGLPFLSRGRAPAEPRPKAQPVDPRVRAQKQKQRRLLFAGSSVLLLVAAGLYAFDYISTAPERAQLALALGIRKMTPGTYEEAVHQFDRAISLSPQLAEAYLNRGLAERNLNRPEAALIDLAKALDLDSSLTLAHDELGQIYAARGDSEKALDQFSKSIAAKPTANGLYQRGQLYEKLGQHQKAIADYTKAIAELADAPYIYFARSTARVAIGDTAGAQSDRARGMELSVDTDKPK